MNSVASLNTIGFKFFSFCSKLDYTYCTFLSQRLLYFWFAAVFSIFASAILLTYPLIRLKPACRACPMIVPIREIVLPSCDDSPTLAFIKVLIFESLLFCCKTWTLFCIKIELPWSLSRAVVKISVVVLNLFMKLLLIGEPGSDMVEDCGKSFTSSFSLTLFDESDVSDTIVTFRATLALFDFLED